MTKRKDKQDNRATKKKDEQSTTLQKERLIDSPQPTNTTQKIQGLETSIT